MMCFLIVVNTQAANTLRRSAFDREPTGRGISYRFCSSNESVKGRIRSLIQMVEEEATQTGTVFDENGLRMRRCIY